MTRADWDRPACPVSCLGFTMCRLPLASRARRNWNKHLPVISFWAGATTHCLLTTISYLLLAYCNYDGWDRGTLWEQPFLFFKKKNCYRFSWTDNALDFIIWNVRLTGTDGHSFLSVTCSDFRLQWNVTQSKTFFSLVFTISFLILRRRVE